MHEVLLYANEVYAKRELLFIFALRDIAVRYKKSCLSYIWVLLRPLLTAFFFSLFYHKIAHLRTYDGPYLLFVLAAMPVWQLFSASLVASSQALILHKDLISKVYFPRILLPFANVLSQSLDYFIACALLFLVLTIYGYPPNYRLLLFFPITFCLFIFMLLLAAFASAITLVYEDVLQLFPYALQLLLFLTPIGYSSTAVPPSLMHFLALNPLVGFIELFRWMLFGTTPHALAILALFLWTHLLAIASFYIFQRLETRIEEFV